ncbi:MAG: glutathione synthase [Myxococcota bacterium]
MKTLFVMDPVDTILVDEDTSFALMREGDSRGHSVDHCGTKDVMLRGGDACVRARPATIHAGGVNLGDVRELRAADYDVIFIRSDPPFDDAYLWMTLILERARGAVRIVNDPRGLRDANEKLYACHFPEVMPETLVSADRQSIADFTEAVGGRAVIKPVDGHGGEGIFALTQGDKNFNACVEAVTHTGRRVAMVQAYLPEVTEGDKRILLAGEEVLGAILRVPQKNDLRSNIHVGGTVEHAELTDADRAIVEAMTPRLKADGLFFVGLDVIGGKLTEVNVTSPTGIQQMTRLSGRNCEARVWEQLES